MMMFRKMSVFLFLMSHCVELKGSYVCVGDVGNAKALGFCNCHGIGRC